MSGISQVNAINAQNLIASFEFPTGIRRSTSENERHKNAFTIFTSNNIESQACVCFMQYYRSYVPKTKPEITCVEFPGLQPTRLTLDLGMRLKN